MKLRNKKTGKIIKPTIHNLGGKEFNSLAELNAEWEDYEEPKRILEREMKESQITDDDIIQELLASGKVEIECICNNCLCEMLNNILREFDNVKLNIKRIEEPLSLFEVTITLS